MARSKKNEGVNEGAKVKRKKESRLTKFKEDFKAEYKSAKEVWFVPVIFLLLCAISLIFAFYLYQPAREIYYTGRTLNEEINYISDYEPGSQEREEQIAKKDEAEKVYIATKDKFYSDSNSLISGYARIHNDFLKGLIFVAIILPFIAFILVFLGNPIRFLLAVVFIVGKILHLPIDLFNLLRSDEKKGKRTTRPSKHTILEEAAN